MSMYYIEVDGVPMPTDDINEWHRRERRVALDEIGPYRVSTVFLGLDHGFGGVPLLYETMIFGGPDDRDDPQWRYSTRPEALAGHEKAVALAKSWLT